MVIESLGVYLPPTSVSSCEVVAACKRRILFPLEQITGIRNRRVAQGEFSIDLATKAVNDCLERSSHPCSEIDLLICCNISRYDAPKSFSFEPTSAISLKEKFGLEHAITFDISNACAGMFTALYVAESFLKSGAASCALVVSGEFITHLMNTAQDEMKGFLDPQLASLTLGDSGVAMLLERANDPAVGFQNLELFTLGKYSEYCVAEAADGPNGGAKMVTDSARLASVAVVESTAHAVEMQERHGWVPERIHHFIMHQTSERTIRDAMKSVNRHYGKSICSLENTIFNVKERGNTSTTSHFVALKDACQQGRIKEGESVVFSVNASGLTVGGARYTLDGLPGRLAAGYIAEKLPPLDATRLELPTTLAAATTIKSVGLSAADPSLCVDSVELAVSAAEDCLSKSSSPRDQIDLLIFAGVYRTRFVCEPALAAIIGGKLGVNDCRRPHGQTRTLCFDVLAGAAGPLKACLIASQFIETGKARRVMIVTSEITQSPCLELASSGSALLLENSDTSEIAPTRQGFRAFHFRDLPEKIDAYRSFCDLSVPGGKLEVHRNPELERLYLDSLQELVAQFLSMRKLAPSDIGLVVGPQISSGFLAELGRRLGMEDRMVDAVDGRDDLFTSSIAAGVHAAQIRGLVPTGTVALFLSAASGIQVGCALYQF
jgi:3-oxoacyl-[acyl-carrier-protein] synthase III